MDIVCPIIERDFQRFKTLFKSLEKFSVDPFKLYLISDTGESPIYDPKIIPIKETKLDRNLDLKRFKSKGWWKQQVIKLLSHKFCDSPYILVLDADCFAVRLFSFTDFLHRGKIKTKVTNGGSWDNWYTGSAAMLQLDLHTDWKENRIGVTPFIFSNDILAGLAKYLNILYKNPTLTLLDNTSIPNVSGMNDVTWSEYCLYHIYGINAGLWDKYHHNVDTFDLHGNSFWNHEETAHWDPEKSFNNPKFYFSVAQSIAGQSADWVSTRIDQYIS